jgi:hypothetical protein
MGLRYTDTYCGSGRSAQALGFAMEGLSLDTQISYWLSQLLTAQPPTSNIVAFNVGLFETSEGYCAYLSGATRFDASSDNWALEDAYSPSQREFPLPRSLFPFSGWEDALSQVQGALKLALSHTQLQQSPLAHAQAVTVGFDDGDLERVM